MVADTWYLFGKYMRITMRMPLWTLFTLVQPLIWLVIFAGLFKGVAQLPGFPAGSYVDFFVPGVLVMTVLFGSAWSGVSLLREITFGTVEKMLVTPVSRVAIVFSRLLHSAVQVIVQVLIMLCLAWGMGTSMSMNPVAILLCLLVVFLLGLGFAGLSNAFAIILQREEPLVVIGNMMTLPLMFFSSAMMPKTFMPGWIRAITVVNPIDYAVESIRAVMVGETDMALYVRGLAVLVVFAVGVMTWAIYVFNTKRD